MPEIVIYIVDGQVTKVTGVPNDTYSIIVRDYDIPNDWTDNELFENTDEDDDGDPYQQYEVKK